MRVIVYLNNDAFEVDRDAYLAKVSAACGDWILVTEWIETTGTFLGQRPRHPQSRLPFY